MADKEVGTPRVEMAEYRPGSWDGLGTPVDYPCGGVGGVDREVNLTANEKAAAEAIASYARSGTVVRFVTGATRSTETTFDPEGFISPAVIASYSDYMANHRVQADGNVRDSDNWQKGMPTSRAYRSLTRHFLDLWLLKRGYPARSSDCGSQEDALHAILFNVMLILKNRIDGNDHEEQK